MAGPVAPEEVLAVMGGDGAPDSAPWTTVQVAEALRTAHSDAARQQLQTDDLERVLEAMAARGELGGSILHRAAADQPWRTTPLSSSTATTAAASSSPAGGGSSLRLWWTHPTTPLQQRASPLQRGGVPVRRRGLGRGRAAVVAKRMRLSSSTTAGAAGGGTPSPASAAGSLSSSPTPSPEEAAFKAKMEELRKLRLIRKYRKDRPELDQLIDKWRTACQEALLELCEGLRDLDSAPVAHLLADFGIPAALVGYNAEDDAFD